jgi:hypothetical protein
MRSLLHHHRERSGRRPARLMLRADMVAVVSPESRGQVGAAAQHVRPVRASVLVAVADGDYGAELNHNEAPTANHPQLSGYVPAAHSTRKDTDTCRDGEISSLPAAVAFST